MKMKKSIAMLVVLLLLGGVLAQSSQSTQQAQGPSAQPPFPDIPAGHWASDAIARVANLGIVVGFPDGTFRGNESFTRYQAALVISRLLDVVSQNIQAAAAMNKQDVTSLQNAVQELSSDFKALGVRVSALETSKADASEVVALKQQVTDLSAQVAALKQQLASLQQQIKSGALQGPAGPQGPQGPQGAKGEKGEPGPQGPAGPAGPQGAKGEKGEPGPQGPAGPQGPQGPQGAKGEKGEPGPQGPAGPAGPQGAKGEKGEPGPQGPAGPQGPQGPQGAKGEKGEPGPQGPAGPAGPQGPKGEKGEPGPQGPAGPQGPQGPQGAKGEKGEPGPQGPAGPAGPQGPKGEKGEPGSQGPAGPTGPAGPSGPQGEAGPSGQVAQPTQPPAVAEQPQPPQPVSVETHRGNFYVSLAALSELNDRVPLRLGVGYDHLFGHFGVRATLDYGRQSPINDATITPAGYLTFTVGGAKLSGYVAAGMGYQLAMGSANQRAQANHGLFFGGVLGAEYGLSTSLSAFVEGGVDYYLSAPPAGSGGYQYSHIYPTIGLGVKWRP